MKYKNKKKGVNSIFCTGMGSVVGSNVNVSNVTTRRMDSTTFLPEATSTLSEREQLKIEFYKTYDVMTGVRIAATLGGFFGLMILLLVYKSRQVSSPSFRDFPLSFYHYCIHET